MTIQGESDHIDGKLVIAHVVEACRGGMATFMYNLIASQNQDAGIEEIHLIADADALEDGINASAKAHFYKSSRNPIHTLAISRTIKDILDRIKPDVVFLHSTFPGVWGRLQKKRSWKIIYCAHGWSFAQRVNGLARGFYGRVEAVLSSRCDAIVSISRSEFDRAIAVGVRAPIHEMIHHGVPPSSATAGILPLRLNENSINLVFVGRFDRQKGVDIIFKIFDHPNMENIHVWFVGRAVLGKEKRLPERNNFHFLGWRNSQEIDAILSQVDAMIVPSRWEGFGLVVLEAMRNGKPVIASKVGGMVELIAAGLDGLFIDIDDIEACRALLSRLTKGELAKMGENALSTYEKKFRWDLSYKRWSMLLGRVIAGMS